jgi:apolipoprotein N-acyltransferase
MQAVRARAIEGRYAIARGAANGISAIISPTGHITGRTRPLQQWSRLDCSDVPILDGVTLFSRWGFRPGLIIAAAVLIAGLRKQQNA